MYTSWSISNIYFLFLKHVLFCLPILLNTQTVSLPTQNTPEKTNLKTLLKNFYWRSLSHTFCIQKAATSRQYCTWKFVCVTISISETSIYAKKIKKKQNVRNTRMVYCFCRDWMELFYLTLPHLSNRQIQKGNTLQKNRTIRWMVVFKCKYLLMYSSLNYA